MDNNKIPSLINENQYPDFWNQIKGFQSFLKDMGKDVIVDGNSIIASEDKQSERLQICNECSQFNKQSKRCYLCGCFMENKIKFNSSKCPASKW